MLVSVLNGCMGDATTASSSSFACLLGLDGYHKHNDQLDAEGSRGRKGRPETLDVASFVADIRRVKHHGGSEGPIGLPLYDRPSHNPKPNALVMPPPPCFPLVVVEGILLFTAGFGFEPLYLPQDAEGELLDLRYFLDLPEAVARARVNGRKVAGGRRHEDVEAHYLAVDFMNHQDMERGKAHAQFLLRPHGDDGNAYAVV
jgi:pantothenate kinase